MGNGARLAHYPKSPLSFGPFKLSKVGLRVTGKPTLKQWQTLFDMLQGVDDVYRFVMGDALRLVEIQYGHAAEQMTAHYPEYDYERLREYRYAAEHVEYAVRTAYLSWSHHRSVAKLEDGQAEWLAKAEANLWTVRELRAEIKKSLLLADADTPPLPPDKYNLIYADPPWRYDFSPTSGRKVERHYPTMELEDIKAVDVPSIAYDNCTLFLWGTSPKLPWAIEVMEAWGFEYKTCMVWVKDKIGMGYYARQQHELLLIGGMGDSQLPVPESRPSSVIMSPRTEHSRKPPEVYGLLEAMYPDMKRAELFGRTKRKGWTVWGNEVS